MATKAFFRCIGTLSAAFVLATAGVPALAAVSVGSKCAKAGAKSGTLVCTTKAGKLVWSKAGAATASAAGGSSASLDGTWKAVAPSVVGYRVKEVLNGQNTEGVGRTSAVTGTLTLAGVKITAVSLTADLKQLKSDSGRRDGQVQGRILDTATHPTATVSLGEPIDIGTLPADKKEVTVPAKIVLTVKGVAKTIPVDIKARRDGAKIQVNGQIPVTFADFGIEDPSIPPIVTTDPSGIIEFLVVFGR